MMGFAGAALAGLLLPATTYAQNNQSYIDYNTTGQPSLYPQTINTPLFQAFPNCSEPPLSENGVCNMSANYIDRARALISAFTLDELIANSQNDAPGVPRLGLPNYNVWNEGLHGVDHVNLTESGEWSWITSFPEPITSMAGLNRSMIYTIADIISTQGRAYNNDLRYGLDAYAPNINGFRSPIWGRGLETPGEDTAFLSASYAYEYITGLQGGVDPDHIKLIATPKHYAGYDIETWHHHSRLGNNLVINDQDMSEYYTPQFLASARYAKAQSLMCSYNAVNGVPSCSNSYLLQTLLRDSFGFPEMAYVSSDCDSIYNVFNPHEYANNATVAASDSLFAGTDVDCGQTYPLYLNQSIALGEASRGALEQALVRLYSSLVRAGWFDGPDAMYRDLTWDDVERTDALNISYEAAVEGIVLLKNDGVLPLTQSNKSVALIGPYANATTQLLGNYYQQAPYIISPLQAARDAGLQVNYALGTNISSNSTQGFDQAMQAANSSDIIIFAGGIDDTIESEGMDRENITWPGNQLDLIRQLSQSGKSMVVLQMGGGQVDSSSIKNNDNIGGLIWGGYPGQSGGAALLDIIMGKRNPAGRLITTQYPADYVNSFSQLDSSLRPNGSNPGQTYKWYTGEPVYSFGHGLTYTTFQESGQQSNMSNSSTYSIDDLISMPHVGYDYIELMPIMNFTASVMNAGNTASPYTCMLFVNTSNAGPEPYPNKWLVGFDRLDDIQPGDSSQLTIPIPLGALVRVAENGDKVIYPGDYQLQLNNEANVTMSFTLTGNDTVLEKWPKEEQLVSPSPR